MATSKLQEYTAQRLHSKLSHLTIKENYRPDWLQNPDGGYLELDFYLPEIKTAIEVQGEQHYKYIPHFHNDYSGFLEQLKRDQIKRDTCIIEGIRLIEVDNRQDLELFLNSFQLDTYRQTPISNIKYKKPVYLRRLERKLARLQDSLRVVHKSLARCSDDNKEILLEQQRLNIIAKMSTVSEKLIVYYSRK